MTRHLFSFLILTAFLILAAGSVDSKQPSTSNGSNSGSSEAVSGRSIEEDVRLTAAGLFTSRFSRAGVSQIKATAAGANCSVLLVTIAAEMDDDAINTLHFDSTVYEGGINHFYRERTFRGVVYRDAAGHSWSYGAVGQGEAEGLNHC